MVKELEVLAKVQMVDNQHSIQFLQDMVEGVAAGIVRAVEMVDLVVEVVLELLGDPQLKGLVVQLTGIMEEELVVVLVVAELEQSEQMVEVEMDLIPYLMVELV